MKEVALLVIETAGLSVGAATTVAVLLLPSEPVAPAALVAVACSVTVLPTTPAAKVAVGPVYVPLRVASP